MIKVYTDGSIYGKNPGGVACWGWIAYDISDLIQPVEIASGYGVACEGKDATNNVAEYYAVLEALRWLARNQPKEYVKVFSDSQLVIFQLTGKYKVNAGHLQKLRTEILNMLPAFAGVVFRWIPRIENTMADALSRKAYTERTINGQTSAGSLHR